MTNVFQDIFGGNSQQSTSTPINMNPLTSALAPQVTSALSGAISNGAPQYTGPLTASTTAAQNTSLANLASAVAPSNNVNSYIQSVLSGAYMPGGSQGPNITAAVNAANLPIQEQLQTALTQTNPEAFTAAGQSVNSQGSSAFQNANALAVQSGINAESANATTIANNAYNTGIQQMTAAAQLQPQEVQSAINVLQAQLLPTLLQEQGITNGLTAFQDNVSALTSFLQTISGAITPVVGNQTQSTGSSTTGILPDLTSAFSGGGTSSNPLTGTTTNSSTPAGNIWAALAAL